MPRKIKATGFKISRHDIEETFVMTEFNLHEYIFARAKEIDQGVFEQIKTDTPVVIDNKDQQELFNRILESYGEITDKTVYLIQPYTSSTDERNHTIIHGELMSKDVAMSYLDMRIYANQPKDKATIDYTQLQELDKRIKDNEQNLLFVEKQIAALKEQLSNYKDEFKELNMKGKLLQQELEQLLNTIKQSNDPIYQIEQKEKEQKRQEQLNWYTELKTIMS